MLKRFAKAFLWTLVLAVLLLGADQLLLRVPAGPSWYRTARSFYTDFRSRLLETAPAPAPSVEGVIDRDGHSAGGSGSAAAGAPRYFYVDAQGQLQFASSLKEIPPALRAGAKRLER